MRADPMTKGTIGRDLILDVMNGKFKYAHPTVHLSTEKAKRSMPSSKYSQLQNSARDDES